MKIVVMASGAFAVPTLRSIVDKKEHEIACLITQPDRPSGRGQAPKPTEARLCAENFGITVYPVADVNDPAVIDTLRGTNARLGLVIAFGQKLGKSVLEAFPSGCVNLHASLLPKYRGAAPIVWAIANGEERTGVTVFRITERMDAGPMLNSRWTFIKPEETAGELHERLARIGTDAVTDALGQFKAGSDPAGGPQDESQASRAPKLTKDDGRLDFNRPARELACRICAFWPWPGAAAIIRRVRPQTHPVREETNDEHVTLARARVAETAAPENETPGMLDHNLYVCTGLGKLEILELRPASGRLMAWQDYVNGRHLRAGDKLLTPS